MTRPGSQHRRCDDEVTVLGVTMYVKRRKRESESEGHEAMGAGHDGNAGRQSVPQATTLRVYILPRHQVSGWVGGWVCACVRA